MIKESPSAKIVLHLRRIKINPAAFLDFLLATVTHSPHSEPDFCPFLCDIKNKFTSVSYVWLPLFFPDKLPTFTFIIALTEKKNERKDKNKRKILQL